MLKIHVTKIKELIHILLIYKNALSITLLLLLFINRYVYGIKMLLSSIFIYLKVSSAVYTKCVFKIIGTRNKVKNLDFNEKCGKA